MRVLDSVADFKRKEIFKFMAKVLGIDLGTTNSCMAVMEGGDPVVLENSEGGAHYAFSGCVYEKWRTSCRSGRQTPGGNEPAEHGLLN